MTSNHPAHTETAQVPYYIGFRKMITNPNPHGVRGAVTIATTTTTQPDAVAALRRYLRQTNDQGRVNAMMAQARNGRGKLHRLVVGERLFGIYLDPLEDDNGAQENSPNAKDFARSLFGS